MKRDMRWYMDTAKKNLGIKSDIKLARELGMASICRWADPYKPIIPMKTVFLKLARLANVPDEIAMLDLAEMEAIQKDPETAHIFQNIKKALRGLPHIAAMLLVLIALSGSFITFDGGNSAFAGGKKGSASAQTIYIMEHFSRIRAFARSVLSIIYGFFTPALYLS